MKKIELLAPVGDFECLKAAVQNGADSVYFGANMFNARASAKNFDMQTLKEAIEYCNLRNVKSHLTLNILIKNNEFEDAVFLAKKAYEFGVDSIIVQDFGLAKFLIKHFPYMSIHASTQMSVHNLEGALELQNLGFKRVVLARELAINEIEYICKNCNLETEVFIHGALCISYSGQCLFSSLVGGRSANRGKCAGPCRLPYELVSENPDVKEGIISKLSGKKDKVIDKGYLLSTKDLCGLPYIPKLIEAGVTSLKIEGRMKTPEYVATVTKIYRKYIDLAYSNEEYKIDEQDLKELMQVFNRGGFSEGHLNEKENKELIYPKKPNNMGLYLGNISHYNKLKGLITLDSHEKLSIGDTISVEKEDYTYTVSELMIKDKNVVSAPDGKTITFGRMKGNISVGDKVYKLSSKTLDNAVKYSYENYENKKIKLNAIVTVKKGKNISLKVSTVNSQMLGLGNEENSSSNDIENILPCNDTSVYNDIKVTLTSDVIPVDAINSPITEDRIITQISKTKNTPFEFLTIDVILDDGLYIPSIASLNELRRKALDEITNKIIDRFVKKSNLSNEKVTEIIEKELGCNIDNNTVNCNKNDNFISTNNTCDEKQDNSKIETTNAKAISYNNDTKISILFNDINKNADYTKLDFNNIENIYIPISFFMNKNYIDIIKTFEKHANIYIYMPVILKTNYKNLVTNIIDNILKDYKVQGFVISNISGFKILENVIKNNNLNNIKLIGNQSLNVFNAVSIDEYKNLGLNTITMPLELDKNNLNNLINSSCLNTELIVYGNMPLMYCNYCYLSHSNKCYPDCGTKCSLNKKYYLKDRLGMKFRIMPNNIQTITTIYNCKKLSISPKNFNVNSLRIDILDESIDEINKIISTVKLGNKLGGKNYTNGNLGREI